MSALLGGKGANLAEMSSIGLPVPPGFTITTDVCKYYYSNNASYPVDLQEQVEENIKKIDNATGMKLGDPNNPLLLSIRSGAAVSMPGMMDTVLNLGLNDVIVEGLVKKHGNAKFAWDCYRRFIQMYATVVMAVDAGVFEDAFEIRKDVVGVSDDSHLSAQDLKKLVHDYKSLLKEKVGKSFPQDPTQQIWKGISAIVKSWHNPRAQVYRKLHGHKEDAGTAVNIQTMVFGNMGEDCATGVAFTRNPSTGEDVFYGEFLINAQGEDIVAGIRTPQQLTVSENQKRTSDRPSMEESMPETFEQLCKIRRVLESHYADMQDIEFTIQQGKLYILQTRSGKRTAHAAIKIAHDMAHEQLISEEEAILRIDPNSLDQILHPVLDSKAKKNVLAKGLPASPGAATGKVVFCPNEAEDLSKEGIKTILVRIETSPEDIKGMSASEGIVTTRGGMTSHAAVVARGMGRPCVSGASNLQVSYKDGSISVGEKKILKGDFLTIDGSTGEIMLGRVPLTQPQFSEEFSQLMQWADRHRTLKVRTNADTPIDAKISRNFGAEGIGLCRTEHMFFAEDRIAIMRQMILSVGVRERRQALEKILQMQRQDFEKIFLEMQGLPVTVRLLDPPLHEFLPKSEEEYSQLASTMDGIGVDVLKKRSHALHEFNPMLGCRGCRLLTIYPEICEVQARAILEATIKVRQKTGSSVLCEIMIPLVSLDTELKTLAHSIQKIEKDIQKATGETPSYTIGTMIELPRAALCADKIAETADFFSFGTNDLTQTTYGISRDDASRFLTQYEKHGLLDEDPFQTLDSEAVGELIKIAIERGKRTRKDIKLGICGEHGGDPRSIMFFHAAGLHYVSCSPFRVPVARLAAAHAALKVIK